MSTSKPVDSNQKEVHKKLDAIVHRHLHTTFRRPIPDYSLRTFEAIKEQLDGHNGALILDSFCGVGESTVNIARRFPDALVIGIDKSAHRLQKHDEAYRHVDVDNYLLIRADVEDFWRLATLDNWQLDRHFILYPNPWPKSGHFQRRVHGSPVFPHLVQLGGVVELRSNWVIYVEEFAHALNIAGYATQVNRLTIESPITPFERKYHQAGQYIWQCQSRLTDEHIVD